MCRIVAVIVFSFVACVLSDTTTQAPRASNCPKNSSIINENRRLLRHCFKTLVQAHLNGTVSGTCSSVSGFGKNMSNFFDILNQECKSKYTVNNEDLLDFINFSLNNKTFKEFYSDIECVKKMEQNISLCVQKKVGYFNITEKKKHSSWLGKIMLQYDTRTCTSARNVKACTEEVLNTCKPTTRQYIASLFDVSLKNCNESYAQTLNGTSTGTTAPQKPQSVTTTVISVIAVIAAIGIIFTLIFKLRHKINCSRFTSK